MPSRTRLRASLASLSGSSAMAARTRASHGCSSCSLAATAISTPTDNSYKSTRLAFNRRRTRSLAGPFQPSHAAVAALCAAARLRELTLESIREKGLSHFAWVNPGERPGGNMLLANGGELPNNGAFVYQSASGEAVVYSVINKALLGVQEDKDGTRTSEHFSPLSVTPGRLSGWSMSGRMENAALHLDRWTESSRRESGGEQGEQKKGGGGGRGQDSNCRWRTMRLPLRPSTSRCFDGARGGGCGAISKH